MFKFLYTCCKLQQWVGRPLWFKHKLVAHRFDERAADVSYCVPEFAGAVVADGVFLFLQFGWQLP